MARIRHIALIVKEPEKLYDYYHHLFGVEKVRTSPTGSVHVIDGLFNLAFLQQTGGEVEMANTHRADGTEANQTLGINHYGFIVDKLDEVVGKLDDSIRRGESPQNGRPAEMRVIDPWGNNFDLSSRGFLGREEKVLPGVGHMVVQCERPDQAAEFYTDKLDLKELRRDADGSIVLSDGEISMALIEEGFIGRGGIQYYGFQVEDLEETRRRAREIGVEIGAPQGPDQEVRLRDPEGNLFAISQKGWGA
jgi:catechol 2,3-dioxygenase-like lactoylglutathione lyase family enzyme